MGAIWTDGQARMARLVGNHDRSQQAWLAWGKCTNCGSIKVATDTSKQFRPTNAVVPNSTTVSAPPPGVSQHQLTTGPALGVDHAQTAHSSSSEFWPKAGAFYLRHWRIIWAIGLMLAPFGALGSSKGDMYGDSTALNVLKFIGVLVGCWVAAAGFWALQLRHKRAHADS